LWLHHEDDDEWHRIEALMIHGDFKFEQTALTFDVLTMDGRLFGATFARMFGRDAVIAATPHDDDPTKVQVTWRATD
jgi:hypothetical protein